MKNKPALFKQFNKHLLQDDKPSLYFAQMEKDGLFSRESPFILLGDLREVPQSPKHHPEGDVWKHTMLVVDLAAQKRHLSIEPQVFMWSALLHDLGKPRTTRVRKGKVTAYDHDKVGALLAVKFLQELTDDRDFIQKVSRMVRWHMQILFVVKDLPFAEVEKMVEEVPIDEIGLLSLCDRLGRGGMNEEITREEERNVEYFLQRCQKHLQQVSNSSRILS